MKIAVYLGNKPIFLTDQNDMDLEVLRHQPQVVWVDELSTHAINALLHEIKSPDKKAAVMISENLAALKKKFFGHFQQISAAGGLVENEEGKFLFIHRRGHWDLPKGKQEKGESAEECAKREIEEETGVGNLQTLNALGSTFHIYEEAGKHILKESIWFHFRTYGNFNLSPQKEEEITAAKWISKKEIPQITQHTYATIIDLLHKFFL